MFAPMTLISLWIIYFPKRIRDFINDKYSEIVNNYDFRNDIVDTVGSTSSDNSIKK